MAAPSALVNPGTVSTNHMGQFTKRFGLVAAIAALVTIVALPTPTGLPRAGHYMLAILAFAVIIWMTEALDFSVSAVVIVAFTIFLLAFAPDPAKTGTAVMGTITPLGSPISCSFTGPGREICPD